MAAKRKIEVDASFVANTEFSTDMELVNKLKEKVWILSTYGTKLKLLLNESLDRLKGYALRRLEGTSFPHLNLLSVHSYLFY